MDLEKMSQDFDVSRLILMVIATIRNSRNEFRKYNIDM